MPRPKTVPDHQVQSAIAALYARGGDKAVTFATVAAASGLAPPTLVQRYYSRDAMLEWALAAGWDAVDAATTNALAVLKDKGAAPFFKAVGQSIAGSFSLADLVAEQRSPDLRHRAQDWRARIEEALAHSFGTSRDAPAKAAILFATWQGQLLWEETGGKSFRIKDAVRRLA
jgi:AcrR family transcriptional regulator